MSYLHWIRSHVGSHKIILVFASAIVRDENGRILWQKRGDFGWWGLLGGILELDESLPECVVREVKEESGLDVEPIKLVGIYSSPDFDVVYPNGDQVQQLTVCFECRLVGGELQADGEESLALAWLEEAESKQVETAVWYRAMISDCLANSDQISVSQGQAGTARNREPYFKTIRRHVGQARFICPAAGAIIHDNEGRVLLQRRGDDGSWCIPGGGMELGERIDQTIIKEVKEETGLDVAPTRTIGIYSDSDFSMHYPNGDKMKYISTLFYCEIIGGELAIDGDETLELRYFAPDELPSMAPRHLRRVRDGWNPKPFVHS
ncbi:MAG: NUDIX domain-containing protein [Chloroflexota bacterium]